MALGSLAGLAVTNLGLHMDIRSQVNTLQFDMTRLDTLQEVTKELHDGLNNIIDNVEQISKDINQIGMSLNVYMLLDSLQLKTSELEMGIQQLVQDLVLANIGSVTSTLLPIHELIHITETARNNWNFVPFFDRYSIALYYPLLKSYLNGSSVVIDIPFSSEIGYQLYKIIPFPMLLNNTISQVTSVIQDPENYALSADNLKETVEYKHHQFPMIYNICSVTCT